MESLFNTIEDAVLKERYLRVENEYLEKIRQTSGEGAQIARNIAAVFNTTRAGHRQARRQAVNLRSHTQIAPVVAAGLH